MKVLVTGGGGFIGMSLIDALIKRKYEVSSFSRKTYAELEQKGVHQIVGDISNKENVMDACEGKGAVFHIAAKVKLWGKYNDFYSTNVMGTEHIIDACLANGIKYLVFTSSASVVFNGDNIEGSNESLPYPKHAVSNYTATKALAEQKVLAANNSSLQTISLRPHIVWGPGDNHIIPGILQRAKKGRLWQIGSNSKYISTTYISNYTDAQLLALDALINNKNIAGEAFFITNGEPIKLWDFINAILTANDYNVIDKQISKRIALVIAWIMETINKVTFSGKEPVLTRFAVKELCTSHWFDISKARNRLSYNPEISLKEGLKLII